jgi:hypothetical protein
MLSETCHRSANVVAASDPVHCLSLDRRNYREIIAQATPQQKRRTTLGLCRGSNGSKYEIVAIPEGQKDIGAIPLFTQPMRTPTAQITDFLSVDLSRSPKNTDIRFITSQIGARKSSAHTINLASKRKASLSLTMDQEENTDIVGESDEISKTQNLEELARMEQEARDNNSGLRKIR